MSLGWRVADRHPGCIYIYG